MLYTLVYTFSIVVLLKENHALYTCLYFFNCGIVKRKPCFRHLCIIFLYKFYKLLMYFYLLFPSYSLYFDVDLYGYRFLMIPEEVKL